jgi:hypothetical protein
MWQRVVLEIFFLSWWMLQLYFFTMHIMNSLVFTMLVILPCCYFSFSGLPSSYISYMRLYVFKLLVVMSGLLHGSTLYFVKCGMMCLICEMCREFQLCCASDRIFYWTVLCSAWCCGCRRATVCCVVRVPQLIHCVFKMHLKYLLCIETATWLWVGNTSFYW